MTVSRAGAAIVAEAPLGEGERREAAMRRRRYQVVGALFGAGLVTGLYAGFRDGASIFEAEGSWPPAIALVLLVIYLVVLVAGTFIMNGVMDELDRERSYKAANFAGVAFLSLYPVWFLLWKGGFVAEPSHWVMYVAFLVTLGFAALWYRFR
jgi:hypothetical protein